MDDAVAVERAALDYLEGWFDADLERVDRALHPQLVKRSDAQVSSESPTVTTKEIMIDAVGRGGGAENKTEDPITVTVVDIHYDIATVFVKSSHYREYLHLLRTPGGWQIVNVLWTLTEPEPAAS